MAGTPKTMSPTSSRTNWFDDGIFQSKRMRHVLKGMARDVHMVRYNRGDGDWETLCRAVALLDRLCKPGSGDVLLAHATLYACRMCLALAPSDSWRKALVLNDGIVDIMGEVREGACVGWAAVVWAKHGTSYGMRAMFVESREVRAIVNTACRVFDNLTDTRYDYSSLRREIQSIVN